MNDSSNRAEPAFEQAGEARPSVNEIKQVDPASRLSEGQKYPNLKPALPDPNPFGSLVKA